MTRHELEELLVTWGRLLITHVMPSAFPSENVLAKAQSDAARGIGGHVVPNFISVVPSKLAGLVRAIEQRLDPRERRTLWVIYGQGLHTWEQRATMLGIKVAALRARRRKILVKLLDWYSPGAKLLRRVAAEGTAELARRRSAEREEAQQARRATREAPRADQVRVERKRRRRLERLVGG